MTQVTCEIHGDVQAVEIKDGLTLIAYYCPICYNGIFESKIQNLK